MGLRHSVIVRPFDACWNGILSMKLCGFEDYWSHCDGRDVSVGSIVSFVRMREHI
jgi:hypothetical protein